MPAEWTRPPVRDRKLVEALFRSAKHVFETNLLRRTSLERIIPLQEFVSDMQSGDSMHGQVATAVSYKGDCQGYIAMIIPEDLCLVSACDFLGFDRSILELGNGLPVFRDAAGELNNMLAGGFRGILSRHGITCSLLPPVVIRDGGSILRTLEKANEVLVCRFVVEEFKLTICLWT